MWMSAFLALESKLVQQKKMLEKAVKEILRNASCSSSGLISKMFDHQRSIVEEDKENIEEDLEDISTRNILLLQPPKMLEPMSCSTVASR